MDQAAHRNAPDVPQEPGLTVLLVEPDAGSAERLTQSLALLPALRVLHAATVADARELLATHPVDAVLTRPALPDGTYHTLPCTTQGGASSVPVVVLIEDAPTEVAARYTIPLRTHRHPARGLPFKLLEIMRAHQEEQQPHERVEELEALLRALRTRVSTVYHEINNPLAIISGNAQLLLELARVMDLEPSLVQPIEDIEQASQRLSDLLQHLAAIRDTLREHGLDPLENPHDLPDDDVSMD